MPYGDLELGQFGSGIGLVPDGTKPLPEPLLTLKVLSEEDNNSAKQDWK